MGERIKDLIYDFSDIIISLIIITLIFGVVSWKISDSMAYNSFTDEAGSAAVADKDSPATQDNGADTTVTTGTDQQTTTTDPATGGDAAQSSGKPAASDNTAANGTAGTSADNTTAPANTTPPATTTTAPASTTAPAADFKVDIPAGSSGLSIAKILKEKGIISDTKMFITRVDQLKMGSKLKAGSFTIKSGSTLDEVIYTLTGKK